MIRFGVLIVGLAKCHNDRKTVQYQSKSHSHSYVWRGGSRLDFTQCKVVTMTPRRRSLKSDKCAVLDFGQKDYNLDFLRGFKFTTMMIYFMEWKDLVEGVGSRLPWVYMSPGSRWQWLATAWATYVSVIYQIKVIYVHKENMSCCKVSTPWKINLKSISNRFCGPQCEVEWLNKSVTETKTLCFANLKPESST